MDSENLDEKILMELQLELRWMPGVDARNAPYGSLWMAYTGEPRPVANVARHSSAGIPLDCSDRPDDIIDT